MKKLIVIALAVVMTFAVVAFAACDNGETVTGECSYENKWNAGHYYGVKVDVTVKGGVITAVKLYSEEDTGWVRTSADNGTSWTSHDAVEAAYDKWIEDTFVGKSVDTVKGWTVTVTQDAQTVGEGVPHITGGTQSSARIIVAVKNALSKLGK